MIRIRNRIRNQRFSTRLGTNLVEMVLILPVLCIVLVQVTMVIRSIFHLSSIASKRSHVSHQISKLERALRQDAHQASRASWVPRTSPSMSRLRFDGVSGNYVEYIVKKNGLVRTAVNGQGKRSQENFDLFDSMNVVVDIQESEPLSVAVSLYRVPPSSAEQGRLEMHVMSTIGRHFRIAKPSDSSKIDAQPQSESEQ
jgi:hypothetical protein